MKYYFYSRMNKYKLTVGLLILVLSFIAGQYFIIPDFVPGLLKGVGIGILLIIVIKRYPMERAK